MHFAAGLWKRSWCKSHVICLEQEPKILRRWSSKGRRSGWPLYGWLKIGDRVARVFSATCFPDRYFSYFWTFSYFSRYGNFFIFTLLSSFSLLISYFKLTCSFEVLSKPVTSCSNLSLIAEGRGVPGHVTFWSDDQIYTQLAKITSLEHHWRWPCGR